MTALFPLDDETLPAVAGAAPDAQPGASDPSRSPVSFYRKYRPQSFDDDELVGQAAIVRTLRNAVKLDRVAHAYLFCGPRGTGKTTTARILAKAVNCTDPDPDRRPCNVCPSCRAIATGATSDVVEIDAASNRGIDDIRDLRERVRYAPSQLRVKFYIVDEAHQITGAAANAFLKTLEEPPAHTKFVLATTDPEELLPTIVSRCQRFDFRRISAEAMSARLRTVAAAEAIAIADDALDVIARHAGGSLRDALGLLDQLSLHHADDPVIDAAAVLALLGVSRNDRVEALARALAERDAPAALAAVNEAVAGGEDPRTLNRQLVAYLRLLLHRRAGGGADADATAQELAARFELPELAALAHRFGTIDGSIKHSPYPQLPLEVALVEGACRGDAAETGRPPRPVASDPVTSSAAPPPRPVEATPSPSPERPPGPSLRDRVRGSAAPPPAPPRSAPAPTSVPADDPQPTPDPAAPTERAAPTPPAANHPHVRPPGPGTAAATVDVERLADLWPRIRQDVKAVNRRIEALLSSVDPVAVNGSRVTIATAYEFHRDKLNTDDFRGVVEGVLARLLGTPVQVHCVLRSEVVVPTSIAPPTNGRSDPDGGHAPQPAAPPVPPSSQTDAARSREHPIAELDEPALADLGEQRLRAAKNIFDAEEIDPESISGNGASPTAS